MHKVPCFPDAHCSGCGSIVLSECGGETRLYETNCLITIDKRKDSSNNLHNKDDEHHDNVLHENKSYTLCGDRIEEASTDTNTIIKTGQLLYTNMSDSTYNVEQNSIEQMIAHGSKDTDDSDRDNGNTNDNK